MVEAEIARRTDGERVFPTFRFIVHDGPGALTDVPTAVREIEASAEAGKLGQRVMIAPDIYDAVVQALAAAPSEAVRSAGQAQRHCLHRPAQ